MAIRSFPDPTDQGVVVPIGAAGCVAVWAPTGRELLYRGSDGTSVVSRIGIDSDDGVTISPDVEQPEAR